MFSCFGRKILEIVTTTAARKRTRKRTSHSVLARNDEIIFVFCSRKF